MELAGRKRTLAPIHYIFPFPVRTAATLLVHANALLRHRRSRSAQHQRGACGDAVAENLHVANRLLGYEGDGIGYTEHFLDEGVEVRHARLEDGVEGWGVGVGLLQGIAELLLRCLLFREVFDNFKTSA